MSPCACVCALQYSGQWSVLLLDRPGQIRSEYHGTPSKRTQHLPAPDLESFKPHAATLRFFVRVNLYVLVPWRAYVRAAPHIIHT